MKFSVKFVPLALAWGILISKILPLHAQALERGLRGRRRLSFPYSRLTLDWATVVNNNDVIPGRDPLESVNFNSYNPPSVNENGLVVLRARAMGGSQGQVSGIYTSYMLATTPEVIKQLDRDTNVPAPNNANYPSEPSNFATFNEFPSIPRIAKTSSKIASRGQHPPVFSFDSDGDLVEDSRVGTTGLYVNVAVDSDVTIRTGASNIGNAVLRFSITPDGNATKADVFPGSPTITDDNFIAFKANWFDGVGKTGVFSRLLLDEDLGGPNPFVRIASTDTAIPNFSPGCMDGTTFGSTAPPSATGSEMVFVGSDNEDDPSCGGIYLADMSAQDPTLTPLVSLRNTLVPETGELLTKVGEGLSFDGRYLAFWGSWGTDTKTVRRFCPETGNRDRQFFCKCTDTNTIRDAMGTEACAAAGPETNPRTINGSFYQEFQVPVNQGIFVLDRETLGGLYLVAKTRASGGAFDDFIYWNYSGAPPGVGGPDDEGDDDQELPRFRSSAFVAVAGRLQHSAPFFKVVYKARVGTIDGQTNVYEGVTDGIYSTENQNGLIISRTIVATGMNGADFDSEAVIPDGFNNTGDSLIIDEISIEREGLRGDGNTNLAISIGFGGAGELDGEDDSDVEFAGIYFAVMTHKENPGVHGDPHFKTWTGGRYDFHGECDLVMLQSATFGSGLGLDLHIRTTARREFSYIANAALRIGTDVLEVESKGVYFLNGVAGADLSEISGFPLSHTQVNDHQHEFVVDLGGLERLKIKTFKDLVSVLIEEGHGKHFGDSVGLMGDYRMGRMVARDGETVLDEPNAFGLEWQVLETEPKLFQTNRFPQHPEVCTLPPPKVVASALRRRQLSEATDEELAAEKACAHWGAGKNDCVFDVLATGDLEVALAGGY